MQGYKVGYKTPYYQAILKWLRVVGQGKGAISQRELLTLMDKTRPTKSFYRAMTQAELDGLVTKVGILTEKGGRGVAYEVHTSLVQMRLPFDQEMPF